MSILMGFAYMRIPKSGNSLKVCYPGSDSLCGTWPLHESVRFALLLPAQTMKIVTFTFDKIQDYAGQTADQIGLKEGAIVGLKAPEGVVQSLKLALNRI